jgi:hypothetical protein
MLRHAGIVIGPAKLLSGRTWTISGARATRCIPRAPLRSAFRD